MSLFKQFAMDTQKENEGVRIEYSPNKDKSVPTFIIARAALSNQKYQSVAERVTRPHRRTIDMNLLDNMVADKIRRDIFIGAILLGWENIQDEQGKDIPFNAENAEKVFLTLPELFNDLDAASKNAALYRAADREVEAKN